MKVILSKQENEVICKLISQIIQTLRRTCHRLDKQNIYCQTNLKFGIIVEVKQMYLFDFLIKQFQKYISYALIFIQLIKLISLQIYCVCIVNNKLQNFKMTQKSQPPNKNIEEFNKFLTNNADFLQEKYEEYFTKQFTLSQLVNNQNAIEAIKFIYDVFSFGKYENDNKMNQTLKKSIKQNILNFVKSEQQKQLAFDNKLSVRLLQFCIQNNDMFAVHYDKKQKAQQKKQDQQEQLEEEQVKKQGQDQHLDIQINEVKRKEKTQINFEQKAKQSKKQLEQALMKMKNQQQKTVKNLKAEDIQITQEKLKKQAKIVFKFYCKQQLNSGGPNATFDKILHQSSSMTLGKFMAFANTTGILVMPRLKYLQNQFQHAKILDKKTLIDQFKKVSKGKKQMEFQQFFILLRNLDKIQPSIYFKLGIGNDQASTKIIKRLKYLNAPFNMKDPFARDKECRISEGVFIPRITGHSGKFGDSLTEQIQDRKKRLRYLPMQPYPNANVELFLKESQLRERTQSDLKKSGLKKLQQPNKTSFIRQKQKIKLQNSKISFVNQSILDDRQIGILQNLIIPDQYDDQFLKQYKITKKNSILGLKSKALPHNSIHINAQRQIKENSQQMKVKNRKGLVVQQIKERVKQLQKSQRKGQSSIQKKRPEAKRIGPLTNRT